MTLPEQFSRILEGEKETEIIPFLKNLNRDQRKELAPHVKKLAKEYLHWKIVRGNYKLKATTTQSWILSACSFVCFTGKDFQRAYSAHHIFNKEDLDKIIDWYCPVWLSDYFNRFGDEENPPYHMSYEWIMELKERGYIRPTKELIAKLLPRIIFETRDRKTVYKPEKLLQRSITLQEHIWYLFEYETTLYWTERSALFSGNVNPIDKTWANTLRVYSEAGKLNRLRLLRESLLATTRNFNKILTGWFVELFDALHPSNKELLELQSELFNAFNSPHSKPITTALKYIKTIVLEKSFAADTFIDYAPLLLASETKAVVTSTLLILEILTKQSNDKQEIILKAVAQALIHQDENLQTRAAKLLRKYGDSSQDQLKHTIEQYRDSLLSNARKLLEDFIAPSSSPEDGVDDNLSFQQPAAVISIGNEIPQVENFDDLLFLASQAFDNNEPFHIDLLPAALLKLQHEIKGENIARLEPAFQKAYKLAMNGGRSTTGYLDHMLAIFFIEYGRYLTANFSEDAKSIKKIHQYYLKKDKENSRKWSSYSSKIFSLDEWRTYSRDPIYEPYKKLLKAALDLIKNQSGLCLLSTPTHAPAWISPLKLVERLYQYQSKGIQPNDMDFQIAISRCALENVDPALSLANEKLTGEYKELLQYLLFKDSKPPISVKRNSGWMIAALTKAAGTLVDEFERFSDSSLNPAYFTGQHPWKSFEENYTYDRYDYQKRKYMKVQDTRKTLQIIQNSRRKKETGFKKIASKIIPARKIDQRLIYEYLFFNTQNITAEHNDVERLLFLTPNNPEPFIAQIVYRNLRYSEFWEEGAKKMVVKTLETLLGVWKEPGEMAHLFIATCMICSDKTARLFAAEIWIKGVYQGNIKSRLIGEILGKHERIEFAPLKRFTDLVLSDMLKISNRHNVELETMLTSCIEQLPDKPIKNSRKLLEIYFETMALNQTSIKSKRVLDRLDKWRASPGLKKLIAERSDQ